MIVLVYVCDILIFERKKRPEVSAEGPRFSLLLVFLFRSLYNWIRNAGMLYNSGCCILCVIVC